MRLINARRQGRGLGTRAALGGPRAGTRHEPPLGARPRAAARRRATLATPPRSRDAAQRPRERVGAARRPERGAAPTPRCAPTMGASPPSAGAASTSAIAAMMIWWGCGRTTAPAVAPLAASLRAKRPLSTPPAPPLRAAAAPSAPGPPASPHMLTRTPRSAPAAPARHARAPRRAARAAAAADKGEIDAGWMGRRLGVPGGGRRPGMGAALRDPPTRRLRRSRSRSRRRLTPSRPPLHPPPSRQLNRT